MQPVNKPTLYHELHCHEPHAGLETLWFYKAFDPEGADPSDDPGAVRLLGPASVGECGTVAKGIKLVLWTLGQEIEEAHGADD
jgi:hypothetical protein